MVSGRKKFAILTTKSYFFQICNFWFLILGALPGPLAMIDA